MGIVEVTIPKNAFNGSLFQKSTGDPQNWQNWLPLSDQILGCLEVVFWNIMVLKPTLRPHGEYTLLRQHPHTTEEFPHEKTSQHWMYMDM